MKKPIFETISSDAKDFIRKALIKDVKQRWSCAQLLEHNWLKKEHKHMPGKVSN